MKISFTVILVSLILVLSCTPAPKPAETPATEADSVAPATFDEAMGDYQTGQWIENYDAAIKAAKDMGRPILVNFTGSDWCGWCKKLMAEVFSKDEFINYAKEDLILLKLDFPRSIPQTDELKAQNSSLQEKFKIEGYPTIVLLNSEGTEIGRLGYEPGGAVKYVGHLKQLLAVK